jgi:hypothetical protein
MLAKLREEIRALPQANVQAVLQKMVDIMEIGGLGHCLETHDKIMGEMQPTVEDDVAVLLHQTRPCNLEEEEEEDNTAALELETLEVENDYVQQNLEDTDDAEKKGNA